MSIAIAVTVCALASSPAHLLPGQQQAPCTIHNQALQLDTGWIMVDPGDVSLEALHELAITWGLDEAAFQDSTVGRWIYAPLNHEASADQVLRLVQSLAQSGDVAFVSPMLLGGTLHLPYTPTSEVMIQFAQGMSIDRRDEVVAQFNLQLIDSNVGGLDMMRFGSSLHSGLDMLALEQQLSALPDVRMAQTNAIRLTKTADMPNDPEFGSQWGLHQNNDHDMDAPEAWDMTHGDAGIQIVVLDSGIDQNHTDIHQIAGATFTGSSSNGDPGNACDNHGTCVAGCVAATINNAAGVVGVAPNCTVRAGKVFNEVDFFGICFGFLEFQDAWVVDGLGWAASEGARVTNSSWGGGSASASITSAFDQTYAQGVLHVAAAGNDGTATIGWPANMSNMLAVSAMQSNGTLASFSTYGTGLFAAAPGAGIRTTDRMGGDGYGGGNTTTIDGTSFASPYLAGVAAMVLSVDNELSPSGVADVLAATAVDYGSAGWDTQFGHGFVNVGAAVAAADPGSDCAADINGDGMVGTDDILAVLSQWGQCSGQCDADIDGDGLVGVNDILLIIASFGPC
jgi:subtilisin family serine protease